MPRQIPTSVHCPVCGEGYPADGLDAEDILQAIADREHLYSAAELDPVNCRKQLRAILELDE